MNDEELIVPKISQSLMKSLRLYNNGTLCGLFFKAKYIHKIQMEQDEVMKEGTYFEYLCTGALPKGGIPPQPTLNAKTREPLAAYKKAKESAEFFKRIIAHYGIKIVKVNYIISDKDKIAVIDIWAEWDGNPCIIDLKYTSLIDNKWERTGWATDGLSEKDDLMIQGVHYKVCVSDILGIDSDMETNAGIPFYYFVFSKSEPNDMKIIRQTVDDLTMQNHRAYIENAKEELERGIKNGFKAYPEYRRCKDCPLFLTCPEKVTTVSYTHLTLPTNREV